MHTARCIALLARTCNAGHNSGTQCAETQAKQKYQVFSVYATMEPNGEWLFGCWMLDEEETERRCVAVIPVNVSAIVGMGYWELGI